MRTMTNKHVGSSLEDLLREEGIYGRGHRTRNQARTGVADREGDDQPRTTRPLLDPDNDKVQPDTLQRAPRQSVEAFAVELA